MTEKKAAQRQQIDKRLDGIEREYGIRILYAVESGSRAWGFASENSDYDVRFIYCRSVQEYFRLTPHRDVVELPMEGDLDISGWDLMKALSLFRKSNPPLLEWLYSPVVYREREKVASQLRKWVPDSFSPRRLVYHYGNMARNHYRQQVEPKERVILKKYLYVMRALLCIRWVEERNMPPPTSVWETLAGVPLEEKVYRRFLDLIHSKLQEAELGEGPRDTILDSFICQEIDRLEERAAGLPDPQMNTERLDALIWDVLGIKGE